MRVQVRYLVRTSCDRSERSRRTSTVLFIDLNKTESSRVEGGINVMSFQGKKQVPEISHLIKPMFILKRWMKLYP